MQVEKRKKSPATGIDLDAILTPPEAAQFLRVTTRTLLKNVRLGRVQAIRVNARVLRFHVRSLLNA